MEALRFEGADVWFDVDTLQPGSDFPSQIKEGLLTADAIVFLASVKSPLSKWQMLEVSAALDSGVTVIPVSLDPIAQTMSIAPPQLQSIQWLDISLAVSTPIKETAKRIISSVAKRKIIASLSEDQLDNFAEVTAN